MTASPGVRTAALAALAGAAIVFGIVIRVVVYRDPIGAMQGDEALWGLMARHVLDGEVSTFFWGQSYGGTQEVFPVAALFSVFGTHLFLMRIVPIACSVVAGIIVWRIGRREFGELQGIVAGLLLWIWPVYAAWKIEVWSGFYGGGLIYASLVLLLTLRLDRARTRLDSALMGLVIGLALWESVQTVAVIIPALLWLTAPPAASLARGVDRGPGARSSARCPGSSRTSITTGGRSSPGKRGHLHRAASTASSRRTFPMILGLRVPFASTWLLGTALSGVVYAAVLATLRLARMAVAPYARRRSSTSCSPAIRSCTRWSGDTSNTGEPRYVMMLVPALVIVFASLARTAREGGLVLGVAAGRLDRRPRPLDRLPRLARSDDRLQPGRGERRPGDRGARPGRRRPCLRRLLRGDADDLRHPRADDRVRGRSLRAAAACGPGGCCRRSRPTTRAPTIPRTTPPCARRRGSPTSSCRTSPRRPATCALLRRQGYEKRLAGTLIVMLPPRAG